MPSSGWQSVSFLSDRPNILLLHFHADAIVAFSYVRNPGSYQGINGTELNSYRALVSTAVLSYTLGLRHALDADHISVCTLGFRQASTLVFSPRSQAIDLMTRRLIASGQRPVTVGTFFSLGHSTFVFPTYHTLQHPFVLLAWLSNPFLFHQNCHYHFRDSRRHRHCYKLQVRSIQ